MIKKTFTLIFLLNLSLLLVSQTFDCKCCTEFHKQFDFWVGEWVVYDKNDTELGKNSIVKLQDNCVLQENWKSEYMTGTSYNYFNKLDSTWNQIWIDNMGNSLSLKGNFKNGKMILKGELLKGEKIDRYYNQITWEPKSDGTVVQTWETFDDEGQLITTLFVGIYKSKATR